jgi:hypothetical protein
LWGALPFHVQRTALPLLIVTLLDTNLSSFTDTPLVAARAGTADTPAIAATATAAAVLIGFLT